MPGHVAIVGTGPSLKMSDLTALKKAGTRSIGVNRVFWAFGKTKWRPDRVVLADKRRNDEFADDVLRYLAVGIPVGVATTLLLAAHNRGKLLDWWANPDLLPVGFCPHSTEMAPTGWHLPHICLLGGSTFVAIQLEVDAGAKKIDLYGCDFRYEGAGRDHFVRGYLPDEEYNDETLAEINEGMKLAWRIAQDECADRGVEIKRIGVD